MASSLPLHHPLLHLPCLSLNTGTPQVLLQVTPLLSSWDSRGRELCLQEGEQLKQRSAWVKGQEGGGQWELVGGRMGVGMAGVVMWKLMLVGVCFGCNGLVFAHYRPLDMCDFYFRGHKEIAPMLDVLATKNVTSSPPVLTKYDVPVKAGQMSANCSFLPDPSMVFETQEKCVGRFHVKNHLLSGHIVTEEFAVLEEFRIHQVLLPFERIELQDGTVLNEWDSNSQYTHPRRCLTFLALPEMVSRYRPGKDPQKEDAITRVTQMLPKMLNNVHRKKLKKISDSAEQLGRDLSSLVQYLATFP